MKAVGFVIAGISLTCVLWFVFKPQGVETRAPVPIGRVATGVLADARAAAPERQTTGPSTSDHVFELAFRKGRLVSGPALLQVHEGDHIVLTIVSDRSDELHLHGYDLRALIRPDEPVTLRFAADRTGRFGLEMHRAHAELGALEVYPR
jgi:hypothetical protein